MWYRIDIFRFAAMLLPPVLRRSRTFALLKVLVGGIAQLGSDFRAYRDDTGRRMALNGQVIYIEKALNDHFLLPDRTIHVSDIPSLQRTFYLPNGEDTAHVYDRGSPKVAYLSSGSENAQLKFIVNVPSYLASEINDIRNIIDYNKPAGRTYTINIYDYE